MKTLAPLIVALALANCLASAAQADERTVPERFRGEWNSNPADCGTPDNDSIVVIAADRIDFYESSGRVRGAFLDGANEVLVVVEISGEGETSTTAIRFSLSPDGDRLTELRQSFR
ncbi:hypothetical protein LTR94_024117 [Friedmanniomyces endolithicus]|nr:hypothetical protein LTR94_024117 [Friedmanniomyces endolithicus]